MKRQKLSTNELKYAGPVLPADKKRFRLLQDYTSAVYVPDEYSDVQGFDYIISIHGLPKDVHFKNDAMKEKYERFKFGMFTSLKDNSRMFLGMYRSAADLKPYLKELKKTGHLDAACKLQSSYPNSSLYNEIEAYLAEYHTDVRIGFTKVPPESQFLGRPILFNFALVLAQEMKKGKIDSAPGFEAGKEVMRVYADLGCISNELARKLRNSYKIKCQVVHPAGGDVSLTQLAAKAGLGWFGKSGNIISPDFGPRVRISAILIEAELFKTTDNTNHRWIENFCSICGRCHRECPTGAILSVPVSYDRYIDGLGAKKQSIDSYKCFAFHHQSVGCSICLSVCPFSAGKGMYEKLKQRYDRSQNTL